MKPTLLFWLVATTTLAVATRCGGDQQAAARQSPEVPFAAPSAARETSAQEVVIGRESPQPGLTRMETRTSDARMHVEVRIDGKVTRTQEAPQHEEEERTVRVLSSEGAVVTAIQVSYTKRRQEGRGGRPEPLLARSYIVRRVDGELVASAEDGSPLGIDEEKALLTDFEA